MDGNTQDAIFIKDEASDSKPPTTVSASPPETGGQDEAKLRDEVESLKRALSDQKTKNKRLEDEVAAKRVKAAAAKDLLASKRVKLMVQAFSSAEALFKSTFQSSFQPQEGKTEEGKTSK